MVRGGGALDLIATNTIGQGDTRSTGLRWNCKHGGQIYRVLRWLKRPGGGMPGSADGNGYHRPQGGIIRSSRRIGEADGMAHDYFADISWDGDAHVWYVSETNFPGLVAEAPSERELIARIRALVPELYELNRSLFDEPALDTIPLRMTSSRLETIRLAGSWPA